MWDLPGSGFETVSPALPDGFFTTEPPGKPCVGSLLSVLGFFPNKCVLRYCTSQVGWDWDVEPGYGGPAIKVCLDFWLQWVSTPTPELFKGQLYMIYRHTLYLHCFLKNTRMWAPYTRSYLRLHLPFNVSSTFFQINTYSSISSVKPSWDCCMRSWKVELINTEQRKYIAVQGDTKADHKALRGQMQAGAVTKQARDMVQQRVVSYKREGRQQKLTLVEHLPCVNPLNLHNSPTT